MAGPMTAAAERPASRASGEAHRAPAGTPVHQRTPWRFLPGVVVALCFTVPLQQSGVDLRTVLSFLALQAIAYALPGTLAWRLLRGGRDPGIVDQVMGTIAFHALSVPWYLAIRWAGVPHLVWLLPAVTVVVALALGRRRGLDLWSTRRLPPWCAWHAAAALCVGIVQIGVWLPVAAGERVRWQGSDNPFLLSLAGELKHHVPGRIPFVTGQRLDYHWFTFADIASFSWLGGHELDVLTFSLMPLALLTIGLAGFGLLGWRFSGRPVGGVVALWLAVLVGSVIPLGDYDGYVTDSTFLAIMWTGSITQAYAEVLAVALLFVVIDMLRSERPRPAGWALFGVLSFVISGAKASFIPVLGAAALVALAVAHRRRRRRGIALAMGLVLAVELVFAQVVLFGGASQGLKVGPHASLDAIGRWAGLGELGGAALLLVLAFLVLGWTLPLICVGAWLLPGERRRMSGDLASWWLLGMVVSSMIAVLVTTHPGLSQYAFLRSGLPFAYLGVAACLVRLWELATPRIRRIGPAAAALGLGACLLLRTWSEPGAAPREVSDLALVLVVSVLLVALVAATAAGVARPGGRAVAALLVAGAFTLGMGAARSVENVSELDVARPGIDQPGPAVIPAGGIAAARHVRAHSDPDDLFATNAHCRLPQQSFCKNTGHWMSAWTERRAVVEGWGYTPRANASGDAIMEITTSPFWDPALLALNDEVFLHPSGSSLEALLDRFPVRWLIVDRRFDADGRGLGELLPAHRRFGQTVVYDVESAH